MQTFLPYPMFGASLKSLDYRRLGKQRLEARQILNALDGVSDGWRNHPAVRAWEGYAGALELYYNCVIEEWVARGYNNNMPYVTPRDYVEPHWLGFPLYHASHRSRLVEKAPDYYTWSDRTNGYYWPMPLSTFNAYRESLRIAEKLTDKMMTVYLKLNAAKERHAELTQYGISRGDLALLLWHELRERSVL